MLLYIRGAGNSLNKSKGVFLINTHTIAHTRWNSKIPCCLCTEVLPESILGGRRLETGQMLGELCQWKGIGIVGRRSVRTVFICYLNIPQVWLWAISKAKVVCRYMNGGEMRNFDIATGNIGVKGTMLKYNRKEYPKDSRIYMKSAQRKCGAKSVNF